MRVVLGIHSFAAPGGTETYVFTVARELQRLGHQALVAAEELGPMAEYAERAGLDVVRSTAELPPECDLIFAHDGIMAAALAERYDAAPVVYFAHSPVNDVQLPPLVPDLITAVIVSADMTEARMRSLAVEFPIVRMSQPIDTDRFKAGPINERPRRAAVLSGYMTEPRLVALERAWAEAGVECFQVGAGQAELDVVPLIAQADIVVGKGRAALEGMSCGRAVYVYDEFGGDGWVTAENYTALESTGFAGSATPEPKRPSPEDISQYSRDMGWINRELITTHHSARRHTHKLVELFHSAAPRPGSPSALGEMARLARVNWASERRALIAERHAADAQGRAAVANVVAEEAEARAANLRARLDAVESLLGTRRVQAGIALGHALDRIRGRP